MRERPHDGKAASIVREKDAGAFYLFNAGLIHLSVRTAGNFLVPSQLDVPNWNFKSLNSERINFNMKSSGSLSRFLDTALLNSLDDPQVRTSNDINAPSKLARFLLQGRPGRSSNARVERGPSEGARSASRRTTRLPPLLFRL